MQVFSGAETSFKLQKLVPGQRYTFWVMVRGQWGSEGSGAEA